MCVIDLQNLTASYTLLLLRHLYCTWLFQYVDFMQGSEVQQEVGNILTAIIACARRAASIESGTVRTSALAYVVAFSGASAKDVTQRCDPSQIVHALPLVCIGWTMAACTNSSLAVCPRSNLAHLGPSACGGVER